MSLRRKLLVGLTLIVGCTALVGACGVAGVLGLKSRYSAAEEQYGRLRTLYEVGHRVASARLVLSSETPDREEAARRLEGAAAEAHFVSTALESDVQGAAEEVRGGSAGSVNAALARIAAMAADEQRAILANRSAATADLGAVGTMLGGLLVVTLAVAAAAGVVLYRAVVRPLRMLDRGMAEVGLNRYGTRIEVQGDREFRKVMRHFNTMTEAIGSLHASMERQVEIKSRQLVRSEQLAGVGVLAAGLAHEINNPLAIIAGHSQMALRKMGDAEPGAAIERARTTLEVVCEEAFRCRGIATQLLDLAQPGEAAEGTVAMGTVARRAVELVGGLAIAEGREIVFREGSEDGVCRGDGRQLLQVMINLLANALEASPTETGRVEVDVGCEGDRVSIRVRDNGCGMDAEMLARAFDPFYTDKPRRGMKGAGLGLSVSHAIVERHGGRLFAHSAGPGLGSTFVIEIPMIGEESQLRERIDVAAA